MRKVRIAAPAQLALVMPEAASTPLDRWRSLPERSQATVLSLLVRMIADGVLDDVEEVGGYDGDR